VCKVVNNQESDTVASLFDFTKTTTKTHHLVSEFNKANFLLKVNSALSPKKEKLVLEKILNIDQVITAYSIAINNLKSKDQLIFN